jgi:hypothetical protein
MNSFRGRLSDARVWVGKINVGGGGGGGGVERRIGRRRKVLRLSACATR